LKEIDIFFVHQHKTKGFFYGETKFEKKKSTVLAKIKPLSSPQSPTSREEEG